MNPLQQLHEHGQSLWIDYLRRSLVERGQLQQLIDEDGLRGLTSNPSIFEKAIAGTDEYAEDLKQHVSDDPHLSAGALYERLAIEDIRRAADVLRPVYDESDGQDGFVSLEVSPHLARDTAGTVEEAQRLWQADDRPNLMIKVPASPEGIPAIEALIGQGINVNVTLMFSLDHYEAVAHAYLRGLEKADDPSRLASVASFFVSRVDSKIDDRLDEIGTEEAKALRGKIGIANSKMAYQRFKEIFYGDPFAPFREKGARVQRVLWASTSVKDPAYPDTLYVASLIGPDTVNTMTPGTIDAFRDHGEVRGKTLEENLDEARQQLDQLARVGIDLGDVTEELQKEGVQKFSDPFDSLMDTLEEQKDAITRERADQLTLHLDGLEQPVEERLQSWKNASFARRLWQRDPTLWSDEPVGEIGDRLGWLNLPQDTLENLETLQTFADEVRQDGIRYAVVLGMGGSSLAPDVFARTFGSAEGYPQLLVLDSTHPAAVQAVAEQIDLDASLFIVSSKSGTTAETLSFYYYFWEQLRAKGDARGRHFVAITDPGSKLEHMGYERAFRRVFTAPPDVGGRYSALSAFGMVPAALCGMDLRQYLDRAWLLAEACAFCVDVPDNPALKLGAAMGEAAQAGRDKLTLVTSPSISAFPDWLEQLIAESVGKDGRGIVPVAAEALGAPDVYGDDRFFAYFDVETDDDGELPEQLQALEDAGHPVVRVAMRDALDLGREMFRWEMAVAAAGAAMHIHPFNQPNVEAAKKMAREAMQKDGGDGGADVETVSTGDADRLQQAVQDWLAGASAGDYVALQAYLPPTPETDETLAQIRHTLRDATGHATTLGYGPSFLHSTGQLHKGGANNGLFLQLVDEPEADLSVPETDYTFAELIRAQAIGDYQALRAEDRRVLRVSVGSDVPGGLAALQRAVEGALENASSS